MAQQANKENAFDCYKAIGSLLTLKNTVEQLRATCRNNTVRGTYVVIADEIEKAMFELNAMGEYYANKADD